MCAHRPTCDCTSQSGTGSASQNSLENLDTLNSENYETSTKTPSRFGAIIHQRLHSQLHQCHENSLTPRVESHRFKRLVNGRPTRHSSPAAFCLPSRRSALPIRPTPPSAPSEDLSSSSFSPVEALPVDQNCYCDSGADERRDAVLQKSNHSQLSARLG